MSTEDTTNQLSFEVAAILDDEIPHFTFIDKSGVNSQDLDELFQSEGVDAVLRLEACVSEMSIAISRLLHSKGVRIAENISAAE